MKFSTARTVVTSGVNDKICKSAVFGEFVLASLQRHFSCDWGDSPEEDKQANDYALGVDERVLSSYESKELKTKIWIVSEADRSYTTVLFPSEY